MVNAILWPLFILVFILVYTKIRESGLNNEVWKELRIAYPTEATHKELSGVYINIIWLYFNGQYLKRIYLRRSGLGQLARS